MLLNPFINTSLQRGVRSRAGDRNGFSHVTLKYDHRT
jgi:hypothetical protein